MLWIIEPHADDAFLSLHGHITTIWRGDPKTIVTVFSDPRRDAEAEAYARAVGCAHRSLGLPDGRWGAPVPIPADAWPRFQPEDVVLAPLGLRHPDHLAAAKTHADWHYLDAPYWTRQETAAEVLAKTRHLSIVSLLCASEDKRNYLGLFPSQCPRFLLAPLEFPPRLELVVSY